PQEPVRRPAAAERRHPAFGEPEQPGHPRRRPGGLPERPPARGRHRRHRAEGGRRCDVPARRSDLHAGPRPGPADAAAVQPAAPGPDPVPADVPVRRDSTRRLLDAVSVVEPNLGAPAVPFPPGRRLHEEDRCTTTITRTPTTMTTT